ncbi:MAG: glycosyltransferase [Acidobacteriota bacterium]
MATTMTAGAGGIARVARLMARSLAELRRDGVIDATACSLVETEPPAGIDLPMTVCSGSRARFVAHSHARSWGHSHFIYDHLGTARAHCRIPGLRKPFLGYLHGIEIWEDARRDRLEGARRADALLVNSHYTLERARALHGGMEAAEVCWLATEEDEPPLEQQHSQERPRALMVSRIGEAYKGHTLLVDSWPKVCAVVPGAVLTFVGDGPGFDALKRRVDASPVAGSIEMLGFVSETELQDVYGRSSLMALPSRQEGFGLVSIEAMRHALPVLATVHDASSEVNVDGETGRNVDLDEPGMLEDRLIQLLSDPQQALAMGQRGQQRWREHFRYRAFKGRFERLLWSFLERQ